MPVICENTVPPKLHFRCAGMPLCISSPSGFQRRQILAITRSVAMVIMLHYHS